MAKTKSPTLEAWMTAIQAGIDSGLKEIGEKGVEVLRIHEEESDSTGRLRDSFTYATDKKGAMPGSNAPMSDSVDQPKTPFTLNLGTQCPYAAGVNYGREPTEVTMSYEELFPLILTWIESKPIQPHNNMTPYGLAVVITKNILNTGTMAHEFWEPSLVYVRSEAIKMIRKNITKATNGVKSDKIVIDVKL